MGTKLIADWRKKITQPSVSLIFGDGSFAVAGQRVFAVVPFTTGRQLRTFASTTENISIRELVDHGAL